jgi:hypothetical protein
MVSADDNHRKENATCNVCTMNTGKIGDDVRAMTLHLVVSHSGQ